MKRLIALLAGLAVVGSMSMTSFAAFSDEIALNADGTTYTATLSSEAATANAGKQTTIVAYKGDTIDVGSIQYINQEAADSFTFQLKDELTENVKVVMGGEAIDKQEVGTIFFEKEADTYTVSGSVNNFVEADYYDMLVADEIVAEEDLDAYKAAYGTFAHLVTVDEALEFAGNYGDELIINPIATVEIVDGTYAFEGLEAGAYAVVITRDAALPYMEYATVEDADVDMGAVDMLFGDVIGAKDFFIDGSDIATVLDVNGLDITEGATVAGYDVVHDLFIDGGDIAVLLGNNGLSLYDYGTDFINDNL
ncbi:MAG: hypothetical protein E7413_01280 [Ruminococcaceae bacterium]|nr:hypothetical protein [Oscillospiraceae bacterium]